MTDDPRPPTSPVVPPQPTSAGMPQSTSEGQPPADESTDHEQTAGESPAPREEKDERRGDFMGGVEMPKLGFSPYQLHYKRVARRRDRIAAEIARNRRGEPSIPTWALAAILLALIAGFAALVIFS